ncbi:MAG: chemotaxis protein CheW [Armatimonadota bacterium]
MISEETYVAADECEELVVFELAGECYGVDISTVSTIIRMQEITTIPMASEYVDGVINLRGSIIPVINLRKRFGLPPGEQTKASRIMVVEAGGQMIGMIVDAVVETLMLPAGAVQPPLSVISSIEADYLRGVGQQENRLVILVDLDKVLTLKDIDSFSKHEEHVGKSSERRVAA